MSEAALQAVVKRLEAATSRLEEIARAKPASGGATGGDAASSQSAGGANAPAVLAFDELVSGPLKTFEDLSKGIGGVVQEQAKYFADAITAQRTLIQIAAASKKPDMTVLKDLLTPMQTAIQKVIDVRDKSRASPFYNHLSTVSEGIPALGWVVVEPAPAPHVAAMVDAAQFYANRVLKEYKDKDQAHVDWVKSFVAFLSELQQYVKKTHTTGLAWNPRGGDAKSFNASATAAPTAAATQAAPTTAAPSRPAGGFLGELKGDVTSGLRKVDKSEMTHKNPDLRASSVVKAAETPAAAPAKTFGGAAPKAPPKLALEGNKWVVENQMNNPNVIIDQTEIKHVVYIYNCQNSTIQIKGKVNAVTIDGSKKVGVLVENVVSTIDIVNCKSTQLQITGKSPTVVIDKTDGLQLYLSKSAVDVEIFTAKSSEMNVLVEGKDGEYSEKPVSEQFKTIIKDGHLVTVAVEHKG